MTAAAPLPSAPAPVSAAESECAVWAREASFAKSVADHDAKAFAEHVHAKAIFVEGDGSFLRGKETVASSWASIIDGKTLRLAWHPAAVAVGADGNSAISRGPYVFEDLRPEAKQRYRTGTFQSIWVRDTDGAWRVFVDGGTPPPAPATEAEAKKLEAEMRRPCPNR